MAKSRIGVVAVLLAGATAVIVVLVWPRSGGAEHRVRQRAESLACAITQHGLGVRPCASITEFKKMEAQTWRVRFERVSGCFLVRPDAGPMKRACKLGVRANQPHARPQRSSYTVAQVRRAFDSARIVMERLPIPRNAFGFVGLRPANVRKDGSFGVLIFSSARNARAWEKLIASRRGAFPVRTSQRRNVVVREATMSGAQSARLATALKALPP